MSIIKEMDINQWLKNEISNYKPRCDVIPIKREVLGFCGGDYPTAAFLTQLLYWQDKTTIKGNWIAKSAKDWETEIHLTNRKITRVVKRLYEGNLIETKLKKFNGSPITHYRLKQTIFQKAFSEYLKTGHSILTKCKNGNTQKVKVDFNKMLKSNSTKGINPIEQNVKMELDEKDKTITKTTTKHTSKINSKEKAKKPNPSFEKFDINDIEVFEDVNSVVPKEKSSAKKEKVILPFESKEFEQVWEGWKTYRFEKYQKEYSFLEEQAALMPLQKYDEAYAKQLITQAIAKGWKSFHFDETPSKYDKFLNIQQLNNDKAKKQQATNNFKQAVNEKCDELWGNFKG